MAKNIQPLDKNKHSQLKFRRDRSFAHVSNEQLIPIVMKEFPQIAMEWPILFVKNTETDKLLPVALMGLKQGENYYCNDETWQQPYLPRALSNRPFAFTTMEEQGDQAFLCVDEDSELLSAEDGEAMFDEKGEQTEALKNAGQQLVDYIQDSKSTTAIVEYIDGLGLLKQQDLTIHSRDGQQHRIQGVYIIDEKALSELSQENLVEMHSRGLMAAAYSQLLSMAQIHRLISRQAS